MTAMAPTAPAALAHGTRARVGAQRRNVVRAVQTVRTFSNWPRLLADVGRRSSVATRTLTFHARTGEVLSCPDQPGALVPVYEVFAEDCYRLEWFLGPLLRRPIGTLDIGAHIGSFACRLATLHPRTRIDCFEPSAVTANYLRRNVEQNGLAGRVRVNECAVGSTDGWAAFCDNGAGSALNGLVTGELAASADTVRTVSLAEAFRTAPDPVHLVKIDCEGGEYDLVLGSPPQLWAGVERVVLEYHPSDRHTWSELRAFFDRVGLREMGHERANEHQGTAWLGRVSQA